MKEYYIYIVLCFLIQFGCSKNKTESSELLIDTEYELKEMDDKCFELDENTIQNSSYFQYILDKESSRLAFINEYDNSITINDFETGRLSKKIFFSKEGANGVGKIQNFYIKDSLIYIYSDWEHMIYVTDSNAIIKDKISLDLNNYRAKGINPPCVFPTTLAPLKIIGDNLILCGFAIEHEGETSENTPSTVLYNLKDKTIHFTNGFPELYHKGNWGINPTYRFVKYTVNSSNEMIISYPADGYIYVNDLFNRVKKYYSGVKNGEEGLKPITKSRKQRVLFEDEDRHYMGNVVYGGVFYDKYENVYYRIVTLPTEMQKKKKSNMYNKRIQIVVLDSVFNIVGRYNIKDDNYISGHCFLSKKGLHIKTNSDNDDVMVFKTFKLLKNEID